jgi:hypothetical protein
MEIYTIFNTNLPSDFDQLLKNIPTKLPKEVENGIIKIYIRTKYDIPFIANDLFQIAKRVDVINFLHKKYNYPNQKIKDIITNKEKFKKLPIF